MTKVLCICATGNTAPKLATALAKIAGDEYEFSSATIRNFDDQISSADVVLVAGWARMFYSEIKEQMTDDQLFMTFTMPDAQKPYTLMRRIENALKVAN